MTNNQGKYPELQDLSPEENIYSELNFSAEPRNVDLNLSGISKETELNLSTSSRVTDLSSRSRDTVLNLSSIPGDPEKGPRKEVEPCSGLLDDESLQSSSELGMG